MDVRVDVKIPGGVHAYVIDQRGERFVPIVLFITHVDFNADNFIHFSRHDATPEIWQETYLSAILRSILYSDDPNYSLQGYRRLDPIPTPEGEIRFLEAAEALFQKGMNILSSTIASRSRLLMLVL